MVNYCVVHPLWTCALKSVTWYGLMWTKPDTHVSWEETFLYSNFWTVLAARYVSCPSSVNRGQKCHKIPDVHITFGYRHQWRVADSYQKVWNSANLLANWHHTATSKLPVQPFKYTLSLRSTATYYSAPSMQGIQAPVLTVYKSDQIIPLLSLYYII